MINIRKQLVDDLAHRREKLVYALRCPADQEIPKHQLAASIFPPVREPSLYGRGNRGSVHCYKAGGLVPHESAVERDFYRIMEWDYSVETFAVQPMSLPYPRPTGRMGKYTPDCLVVSYKPYATYVNWGGRFAPTVYEIKTRESLADEWPTLRPKLKAARRLLADAGYRFKLLTEDRINQVFLTNITFLLRFRGPRFLYRNASDRAIQATLTETLNTSKRFSMVDFTPRDVLDSVDHCAPRELIIPWLWNLYAEYVIQCDLFRPLTLDTVSYHGGWTEPNTENIGFPCFRPDWRQPENDWRR